MPKRKTTKTRTETPEPGCMNQDAGKENHEGYVSNGSELIPEAYQSPQLPAAPDAAALELRRHAIEGAVLAGAAALPETIQALRRALTDPRTTVSAARTLLELQGLVGVKAANPLSAAGNEGKSIGELEADIERARALIEARSKAGRVVSTQRPTAGGDEPREV